MTKKRVQTYVPQDTLDWLGSKADERQLTVSALLADIIHTVMHGQIDINPLGLDVSFAPDSQYVTKAELKDLLESFVGAVVQDTTEKGFKEGFKEGYQEAHESVAKHMVLLPVPSGPVSEKNIPSPKSTPKNSKASKK